MKAYYKSLFLCVSLSFGLAACDDSTEIPPAGPLDHAEQAALGTYVGEWAITDNSLNTTTIYPGTLSFDLYNYTNDQDVELTEHNVNRISVTSDGAELRLDAEVSACNTQINSAGGISFWNFTGANPFGTTYWGTISSTGEITMKYDKLVRTGRGGKNITKYDYLFKGHKQ